MDRALQIIFPYIQRVLVEPDGADVEAVGSQYIGFIIIADHEDRLGGKLQVFQDILKEFRRWLFIADFLETIYFVQELIEVGTL